MNVRTVRQETEKRAQASAHARLGTGNSKEGVTTVRERNLGDLQAQIAIRAYEFYVQRGCREGCAEEDWLDVEREILGCTSVS